jgi:type IV pilus assembly protein PilB
MIDKIFLQRKVLTEQNYITKEDAERADAFEKTGKGSFADYLLQEGIINKGTLGLAIAEYYGLAFTDLDVLSPSDKDLALIPETFAKEYRVVFIKEKDKQFVLATDTPERENLSAELKKIFGKKKFVLTYAFSDGIDVFLSHYQKELNTRFFEIIKKEKRVAPEILEEIIKDALAYRASDIHFEPQGKETVIRFRIDGLLRLAGTVSREYYENILNRIKIQSNLRTDEHFAPQDGAIRFSVADIAVDLRVSVVPTIDGEKVVIRILAEYVRGLTFVDLGFSERHIAQIEAASKKPFGMILVSGPTGSGKTTTLYALVKKLNTPELNITTIEDPVEYRMVGTNQIQVNQKTNLTFAKGLRAVVRQDPNVILLGEIRDGETAETAVNAALTGHLLLSTFHANDAATSIPRLLEMGVEPFLLASTLELLIAQRLVRRICEACRYSYVEKASALKTKYPFVKNYFPDAEVTLYKGKGCEVCNHTGYKGRTSIVEMIQITGAIKELINKKPSSKEVWRVAKADGSRSLFEDGLEKVKTGITTVDEVLRVASPEPVEPKV